MPTRSPTEYADAGTGLGTSWFVGIIVALALLAIGYLVFSANPPPAPLASAFVKVETATGHGSATHIGDGYFVTAAHVVAGQSGATIDGQGVEILWSNSEYDIALLRGPASYYTVPLACVTPSVGTTADAHGNPVDLDEIVVGVRVAGEARKLELWKVVVPVDGAIASGMSGGGIVADGKLVGVTVGVGVAIIGFAPSLYGVGFIVPGEVVCELMARA